jgi:hypothetical protein
VERARFYFRFHPVRVPLAADPDLITHRAYGAPNRALTPEIGRAVQAKHAELARELGVPATDLRRIHLGVDGFEPSDSDEEDFARHGVQFVGQFLVDRAGIVRWTNIEAAREGLAGLDKFPTDEEFLAAAGALMG